MTPHQARKEELMSAHEKLVAELMLYVRRRLYGDSERERWFSQQAMCKKAILYPAAWLAERGVEVPAHHYRSIITKCVDAICQHGNVDQVKWMSRYFLHCVQDHMLRRGTAYYERGKAIRNVITLGMDKLERARLGADSTVPILAEAHKILSSKPAPPPREDSARLF